MIKRHRIPSIFNIYMVDVLCCALGCVILLWQLNYHEAQEQGTAAEETGKKLAATETQLSDAQKLLAAAESRIASLSNSLIASKQKEALVRVQLEDMRKERNKLEALTITTKKEYEETRAALDAANTLIAALRIDVKTLEQKNNVTVSELADKIRAHGDLLKKLAAAGDLISGLEKTVDLKNQQAKSAALATDALFAKLKALEDRALGAESQNADLKKQIKDYQTKLTAAEIRALVLEKDANQGRKSLVDLSKQFQDMFKNQESLGLRLLASTKDLEAARKLIDDLSEEKLSLARKAQAIQSAADNRFAGIHLTGRKVLFLVDMSGSMELLDVGTQEPDKWPIVCETVGQIMQSLPDLRNYQVILFSDKVRYPLGKDGQWLDYYAQSSKKATVEGLKAVKPNGETNMYAAMQEAFRFRADGLDTIYIISDGLPNAGPGLPTTKTLTEAQKTEYLAKRIRQTLRTTWNTPVEGQRVRINTIGFFFESPDVGAFLWALSRENDGGFVGMSRP